MKGLVGRISKPVLAFGRVVAIFLVSIFSLIRQKIDTKRAENTVLPQAINHLVVTI
jgi:hypothetical protein